MVSGTRRVRADEGDDANPRGLPRRNAPNPGGRRSAPYDAKVIEVRRSTPAAVESVWGVLADGFQYAAWVVGAARVRAVDDGWPEPGSRIHHSAGSWPLMINDTTTVLSCVPNRELVLQARGWPAGEARVELELLPSEQFGAEGCQIVIREDATHGPGKLIPELVRQLAIAPRNVESLKRLAYLAERPRG